MCKILEIYDQTLWRNNVSMLATFDPILRRPHSAMKGNSECVVGVALPNIFTFYPGQKGSNLNPPLILSLFFSIILPNPNIGPDLLSNRSQLPSFMFLQHNFSLSDGLLIRKTITTTIESSLCEGWMKCSLYERGKAKVRWLKVRKRRDHLKSWVLKPY